MNPCLLNHIQCYFHCTPLVLINLMSHFLLLSGAERKRGSSIFTTSLKFPSRGLPRGKYAPSLSELQGIKSTHLHSAPPRPCMVDGEICRDMKEMSPRPPSPHPGGHAPQHAKSGAQRDKDSYLICWYLSLSLAPLAPQGGSTHQKPEFSQ